MTRAAPALSASLLALACAGAVPALAQPAEPAPLIETHVRVCPDGSGGVTASLTQSSGSEKIDYSALYYIHRLGMEALELMRPGDSADGCRRGMVVATPIPAADGYHLEIFPTRKPPSRAPHFSVSAAPARDAD